MFRYRKIAAAATSLAAVAAMAIPASADDTTLTLTLTSNGLLSIDAPDAVSREVALTGDAVQAVTMDVDGIIITDERLLPGAFVATAASSGLTRQGADSQPGDVIPGNEMAWLTTRADSTGAGAGLAIPAAGVLDPGALVAVGLGLGLGAGEYSLDADVNFDVAGLRAGTYQGVVTTSIS